LKFLLAAPEGTTLAAELASQKSWFSVA
jgi:hypothetical protein